MSELEAVDEFYPLAENRTVRKARNAELRDATEAADEALAQVMEAWRRRTAAVADFDAKNAAYHEAMAKVTALLAPPVPFVAS